MNRRQTRWTSALTICAALALVLTARAENWTARAAKGLGAENGCRVQANGQAVLSADKPFLLFGLASEKDETKEEDAPRRDDDVVLLLIFAGVVLWGISIPFKNFVAELVYRKYIMVGREPELAAFVVIFSPAAPLIAGTMCFAAAAVVNFLKYH